MVRGVGGGLLNERSREREYFRDEEAEGADALKRAECRGPVLEEDEMIESMFLISNKSSLRM
jgi:hypothetical protein